uniref:Probable bifunctional methylthioribulose-1-phosphate dehydratase/enolase-phosphatase E1 n=1 Tax=Wollemia nobilis TaxID=56998 RepID=A0A0C9S9A4_9CONI
MGETGIAPELSSEAYVDSEAVAETKMLAAELCKQFYGLGWVSGTGGSITIKAHDPRLPKSQQLIVMAPSGVQKERMAAEDMYVLSANGSVLSAPSPKSFPHKPPKCSECGPLFLKVYHMCNAGAVIHSHGLESCLATMIDPSAKEFRITHMEMIKGIQGHGYYDELVVPIIENTAREYELTEFLAEAIAAYPKTTAVLVRNHGIYIWGDSWISAKTQAECYHYLFDAAFKLSQIGLDPSTPNHGPISQRAHSLLARETQLNDTVPRALKENGDLEPSYRCIVLDIEGTTTPISFVSDILFPYARDNVASHLRATYDTEETQADVKLLRMQVDEDLKQNVVGAQPIPPDDAGKDEVINALVANVSAMISADRKITALKQLQGHIWRTGYARNELQGELFEDVPLALSKWHAAGIKVYIYSSGSREAQRLIFGNTKYGDLRKFFCGFFDTTTGNKRESRSYSEICKSLGVDEPSQVLFATDVLQEAVAAKNAGLQVVISLRPGNAPLPPNHGFRTVSSLLEI